MSFSAFPGTSEVCRPGDSDTEGTVSLNASNLEHVVLKPNLPAHTGLLMILTRNLVIYQLTSVRYMKAMNAENYFCFLLQHKSVSPDRIGIWECFRCITENHN